MQEVKSLLLALVTAVGFLMNWAAANAQSGDKIPPPGVRKCQEDYVSQRMRKECIDTLKMAAPEKPAGEKPDAVRRETLQRGVDKGPAARRGGQAMPGHDTLTAIQVVVNALEAKPDTDWSQVNFTALREHLVQTNLLAENARVTETAIDGGQRMALRGDGETLAAIQAQLPKIARSIGDRDGWQVDIDITPDGGVLSVTSGVPEEAIRIRALGFFGLLATEGHRHANHVALAKGEAAP